MLSPQKKVWIVTWALIVLVFAVIFTPFIITSRFGAVSEQALEAFFLVTEFAVAVLLLKRFNQLRLIIKKQAMTDQKLDDIESGIKKLSAGK